MADAEKKLQGLVNRLDVKCIGIIIKLNIGKTERWESLIEKSNWGWMWVNEAVRHSDISEFWCVKMVDVMQR